MSCTQDGGDAPGVLPELEGPYLGQTPPGLVPEIFAVGIVSTTEHNERDVTFTPGMKEFYFTRDAVIMVMRRKGDYWTEADTAGFSGTYPEFEACVAPDGRKLYYISRRPLSGEGRMKDWQIWVVRRRGKKWVKPEQLTNQGDYYPTLTQEGRMYFTGADNDIYRADIIMGQMGEREKLGESINTDYAEYNACIAPDESFLVFTSLGRGPGYGGGDLFVSFRNEDDGWTEAKNMGCGVNSSGHEYCPSVSPDGKYFFFCSDKGGSEDIYWVDAEIIDSLRTMELDFVDLLVEIATDQGVKAAVERYQGLVSEYGAYCDFKGDMLTSVGDRLLAEGQVPAAAEVIRRGLELYPKWQPRFQRLKLALLAGEYNDFKLAANEIWQPGYKKMLELEGKLNIIGYRILEADLVDKALLVFQLNMELFPQSFNVYDSYAEALFLSGDTMSAISNYKKSLALNPDNTNAAKMIEQLGGSVPDLGF
jgi:tetratricopeptide (TPR) repeat protein